MSIRCIIVEDQEPAQRLLKSYINDVNDLELVAKFGNAIAALEFLKDNQIDLILLDIHLPKLSGMDFLEILNPKPQVILTTAFADYALKSYDFEVTDYLLKPFSFERFIKAIVKVRKQLNKSTLGENRENELVSILVKVGYEYIKIIISKILYIKSDGDYTQVITHDQKYLVSNSLRFWVEQLPETQFKQVHRSYIVNLNKIVKLVNSKLVISDSEIPVGRVFKKDLVKVLKGSKGSQG